MELTPDVPAKLIVLTTRVIEIDFSIERAGEIDITKAYLGSNDRSIYEIDLTKREIDLLKV